MKLAIGLGLTAVLAGEVFGLVATARDAGGLAALDFLEPRDKKTQFDGWKVRCGVYEAANTVEYDKASKVIRDYLRDPRWEKSNGGGVTMQGEEPLPNSTKSDNGNNGSKRPDEPSVFAKMGESAATTFASILVLGLGFAAAGYIYHKSYKMLVMQKMTRAFKPGDPVLELAAIGKDVPHAHSHSDDEHWVVRPEQTHIDDIVSGREVGHYYLIMGDKGSGKSSMIIEAMRKNNGDGVAMFEAHSDPEIFRIRLGKALDYEFHEDYIGGYFSERGPRESTALLDIERALNKLEKVAMRLFRERAKPLVVIVNQMHLLRNDEDGRDLIELLQQRAEQWAAANLVTMVFNSDDYWVYERLKKLSARMEVLPVTDLPKAQAISALHKYRMRYFGEHVPKARLEEVYDRVGGRLSFLNRVAKSRDMLGTCERIKETEKKWFLNQCWILGSEMDDDVMDQQKWAAAAMVLAQALVDKEGDMERTYDPVVGHLLPSYPFHIAQELMTRCDFIRDLDRMNLFTITSQADVRASSVPMHLALREICAQEGFRKHLEDTIERIGDIESLGRTRELVAKDLVLGGQYDITTGRGAITVKLKQAEEDDDDK
ncbi:ATPase domain-containingprotein [Purpureocillium lilacinum]|uniref:ATPase domain-containingprotein n=1 Tax=Purpureocillium lilacinum TaxID=33203 RepID=A0A179G2R5_PURLI|nr:ATPase domain-containingprotein [Purpureocillium lilacinum]